ncbi:MAG: hypothetical protein HOP28_10435 [Gemmatimonadales bacterium]|nr:hypothetical protein [Gemmatimonadales bacterium]
MQHASWPWWMSLMVMMMFMGPAMRFTFGHRRGRMRGRDWERDLGGGMGREDAARLDNALAERDNVIEDLQRRLTEMESRLDFAERLIAERSESHAAPRV